MSWMRAWKDHRRQGNWDRTRAQAEALFLLEAKFAESLEGQEAQARQEALASWVEDVAALASRYLAAGGAFRELQERFGDLPTPFGGRFFLTEDWP